MFVRTILACSAAGIVMGAASTASAQSFRHYFDAGIGANFITSDHLKQTVGDVEATYDYDTSPGLFLSGAVGLSFPSRLRTEVEVSYRTNEIDEVDGFEVEGDAPATAVMFNGYLDIDNGSSQFVPYIGAGIGYLHATLEPEGEDSVDKGVFAWQLKAGMARYLDMEGTSQLGAEVSYLGTQGIELPVEGVSTDYDYSGIGARVYYRHFFN